MSSYELPGEALLPRGDNFSSGSSQIAKRRKIRIDCLPVSDQRFKTIPEEVLDLVRLASQTDGHAIGGKASDALSPAELTVLTNYGLKPVSEVTTGDILAIPLARPDADENNDIGFIHSTNFLAARVFRTPQGVGSPVYCEKLAVRAPIEDDDEDTHKLVAGIACRFVVQDEFVLHLLTLSGKD